jgi:hypothetical protein
MKIVKDANNAVDVERVQAMTKTGSAGSTLWFIQVYLIGSTDAAPFRFDTEEARDQFYADVLAAVGG